MAALFGGPWTVEARKVGTRRFHRWQVEGWTASRAFVTVVADQIRTTGLAPDAESSRLD